MTRETLFEQMPHPFAWTTESARGEVLKNVEDPIWHRFLEEAESHFVQIGGLPPPRFPVFCHDGDLDEVMAVAVLAYVRQERRLWEWLADWLRGMISYYRGVSPEWKRNLGLLLSGECPRKGNPRQFIDCFTKDGIYWVEGGLMSTVLHLYDLLEAYAADTLTPWEKRDLRAALSDYADRYAFHEEAFKYSNRGVWANAGILVAAVAHADPKAAQLLLFQAKERYVQQRSTLLDDGSHIEGSPDYHIMTVDGLLCFALTAARIDPDTDYFRATSPGEGISPFLGYPSMVDAVRSYLRTAIPGPLPLQSNRGVSLFRPLRPRPSMVHAYGLSRDSELGWFLHQSRQQCTEGLVTPLKVTRASLLGLGDYQPLLNFWLSRPIGDISTPKSRMDVLSDHGSAISRSGWDGSASSVSVRFGYEGAGKGHRDHGHVTLTVAGSQILSDPFPRVGPPGNAHSLFHNTVTLDNAEPAPVIGRLLQTRTSPGADAFFIVNSGGKLPDRILLHDPRQESNYWFTSQPTEPDFQFKRVVLHRHGRGIVVVDQIRRKEDAPTDGLIDWFFHTPLVPEGYRIEDESRTESYRLKGKTILCGEPRLDLAVRGAKRDVVNAGRLDLKLEGKSGPAWFRAFPLGESIEMETGHHDLEAKRSTDGISFSEERHYFLRFRMRAREALVAWIVEWGTEAVSRVTVRGEKGLVSIDFDDAGAPGRFHVDFERNTMELASDKTTLS